MADLYRTSQYFLTTLSVSGGIDASQTTDIVAQAVLGVDDTTKPGIALLNYSDPLDTSACEWITYTSINSTTKEFIGVVRGQEGFSAKAHSNGVSIAFPLSKSHINNIVDKLEGLDDGVTLDSPTLTSPTITGTALASADGLNVNSMSRQAIINGNFDVWQRGVTLTPGTSGVALIADRWKIQQDPDGGTLPTVVHTRQSLTPGDIDNAFYHYRVAPNGAGTSLGNNSYGWIEQRIEHGTRLLCGLNKKVTVSFYAKSDIANKKLGVGFIQNYGSGGSPTSFETLGGEVISLTSSWTKYTVTITTNTLVGKTFGTANDDYFRLLFGYQWGSAFSTRFSADSAETYVGSGNIDIAQVQLCAGDVALPFQPKSYEEELRACQRYYEEVMNATYGWASSASFINVYFPFRVTKRATPTYSATEGTLTQCAYNLDAKYVHGIYRVYNGTNATAQLASAVGVVIKAESEL